MTPISWEQFYGHVSLLADKLSDREFIGILAIERGGLIPASILAYKLGIRYVHTIKVDAENRAVHLPKIMFTDYRKWLIVDEFCDTGTTMKIIKDVYRDTLRAAVYTRLDQQHLLDHYGAIVPDTFGWVTFCWEDEFFKDKVNGEVGRLES